MAIALFDETLMLAGVPIVTSWVIIALTIVKASDYPPISFDLKAALFSPVNASYLTLKMESVSKITIFGLKMMMKSGLEKIFLKFLHAEAIFF